MPPHCDTLDGPIVTMARKALEAGNVDLILPYAQKSGEGEIVEAFKKTMEARKAGGVAREVADLYFFETVVRLHRAGEGAPFTGLKPAGLSVGPIIPLAEKAIETGSPQELIASLKKVVDEEIQKRFDEMVHLKKHAAKSGSVDDAREYVEAMLGFQVYSHGLYTVAKAKAHEGGHGHGH
ncbi:hypothetical protein HZA44_03725 [Candidatus Peregrinibacteria bacterium]|nr:hypothetical protein [Candidatus Peregrinibacteria bacterium]